jgi:elongation factor P
MHDLSEFKKGLKVMVDGQPYQVLDFQHVKPGKGNQFTRTKLRNLITGSNLERTFKSGEKFEEPDVVNREVTFLYQDEAGYNFMDQTSYEQLLITNQDMSDEKYYLVENLVVVIMFYNGKPIGVAVPNAVNLTVKETEPAVKGDRVTGATKKAKMQTDLEINVPLHIKEGDILRIDTRTGEYVERVNK